EARHSFLPRCLELGVGVIVGGPFNSGILVTGPVEGAMYNYAPASHPIRERVARIGAIIAAHGICLPAAALAFPLRHPAVATVIPGLMTVEEVKRARDQMLRPIPEAMWQELAEAGLAAS